MCAYFYTVLWYLSRYLESLDPAVLPDLSQTYQSLVCGTVWCGMRVWYIYTVYNAHHLVLSL